jgi:hypothetical protein
MDFGSMILLVVALLIGGLTLIFWIGERVMSSERRNEIENERPRRLDDEK